MGKLKNFFSGLFGKKEETPLQVKNDGQEPKQTNVITPKKNVSVSATKKEVQSVISPKIKEEITPIIATTNAIKKEDSTITKPMVKEEKPLSEEEKFYREMKEICKPSTKFRVEIVNTYFMWASLYYEGDEKSVIIPKTVEVDGQEYNVRFLYSAWSQEISLENIFIEAAELTIANQYFKNVRNIYFSSDVKKCEVYISDKKIIPTHLERINLTGAPQSVKEYLLSINVGLIPYFKTMPSDENGLKRLDGHVVGAEKTVELYDSRNDDDVNLQWVSAECNCKKVIIRKDVNKILFPDNRYDFKGDFEVVNNPKFILENNILYSVGKKKEMLFVNSSYNSTVLHIDKTVDNVACELPRIISTLIIEGVCKFNIKTICLDFVNEIVIKNPSMAIKDTWFFHKEEGATIYANEASISAIKTKRQYVFKSLNEYRNGEAIEDVAVVEETITQDSKKEAVVVEVVEEPIQKVETTEKVVKEEVVPIINEEKEEVVEVSESACKEVDEEQLKAKYSEEGYKKLEVIYRKLLNFYPEKKIFAFDALCSTIRDTLSSEAKKLGIGNYREILVDFGFEFIEKEETELLRNKVIYTPGNEPEFMMAKIKGMLSSLASYYPNKIIEKSIISEHQKLAGNITGLYQWFGYPNANEFLAAYGYDYKIAPPVNVVTFDTNELIEELQRRTEGKRLISLNELRDLNPDLAEKIEIVRTRSVKLYGTTFVDYLQSKGILYSAEGLLELKLEDFMREICDKYPNGSKFFYVNQFFAEPSNSHYDRASLSEAVRNKYSLSLQEYLVQEKILVDKKADDAVKFADFELNSTKARIMSYHGSSAIVEIPAEIKIIEKGAFKNTAVEEISFKSDSLLTTIEEGAFEGCKNLKSIDFTNITKSVKIKSGAFKNCEELREIYNWQKIAKVYEGAFEGAKNIFIYDGEYIYPRLWLYNLSNNGCSGSTVFGIDETYGDDCTPLVEILTPYGRIEEYNVQMNEIPIASRCGYNGIVYSGLYDFDNEDACYSSCKREFYMEFDLPTVESVSVYLKNYEIEIDESEKLDILKSEDKYIKKQRAIFENLKTYATKRKAERKEKGLPEELSLENFPLITKPGEKQVYVKFIGGREYNYNCRFDVKKGDLVFVDGSMEGVLGCVDSVENGLASGDFMKDVVKAYAVKKSKSVFPYAIEEKKIFEVFPNLQVEERDEEDYDEEYDDADYDECDEEDNCGDIILWKRFKGEEHALQGECLGVWGDEPKPIKLTEKSNIYFCSFYEQDKKKNINDFDFKFVKTEGKTFIYHMTYKGESMPSITFESENGEFIMDKSCSIKALAMRDEEHFEMDMYKTEILIKVDFRRANGSVIDFPVIDSRDEESSQNSKSSKCKVKVKFPDNRSYVYNCEYAINVGDKVQVGGKRSDQVGEVVSIEGKWDSSPYMQCVEKVFSSSGEVKSSQSQANGTNSLQEVTEKPLIVDDDYPFGYERDDKMIKLINSARQGNQEAIKELVGIYSASNNAFVKEQKAEYWKRKLNKGDKMIVEGKTINMLIKESVDSSIGAENFSVYLSVEDKNGTVVVLAESGRSKDDEYDESDCRLCYYGAKRSSEDGYEWLTNYLPSEDEYIREFIMDISIKDTAEILVGLIKGKTLPTNTASIGKAIKKYLKRKGVLVENICKYTIGCHEYPYSDNGYYPEAQWVKVAANCDFESLAKEYNTDVDSLKTYLRFVEDEDLAVTLVRTETHDLQSGEVINTVKMYDYENDFRSGERAMWEWDFMSEEEDDGFYDWETSEEE